MATTVNLIRLKARRIAEILPKREGMEVELSVYNPGDGKNYYQLNWKEAETGGEWHIGYNCHINGKAFYAFLEGIEAGLYEQERKIKDQQAENALLDALQDLTEFCTSGERYKTQNPYTIPEIKAALIAIGQAKGLPVSNMAWMDANKDREP